MWTENAKNAEQNLKVAYRLSALGDVALLSGVLDYWHRTRGWRFVVVTRAAYGTLFERHPAVAAVEGVTGEQLQGLAAARFFRGLAAKYRGLELLDLHGSLRSRLLSLLWKGKVRRYPKLSLERRLFLRRRDSRAARKLLSLNVTQRYALAVESSPPPAPALRPVLCLADEERLAARQRLKEILPAGRKLVILHPYATHARKEWPRESWFELARGLEAAGYAWLIVGQGEAFFPHDPRDLSNRTGLRELCAVLELGDLLVSGDSGPLHLGAAVGLPLLALFGPTTREWGFFPVGPKDRVLELALDCRPCSLHGGGECARNGECLRDIAPQKVLEAVRSILK